MEVLRTEKLSKVYGNSENKVEAIKDISISVKRGEFVAIMGPSGSGKSTLLHTIGGIERPTSGKVFIDGIDIYNLIPVLNVVENISLPLVLDGRKINDVRINEMLEMLNLTHRANFLPGQLSGGQQQRVSIGRALINAPAIVLADEPTGNLDSKNSQDILELFKLSNKKYKQTLIIITHDEEIALQADRIITIDDGKVIKDEETI